MLKIATVFSGIGAIEHALERMGIEYQIELACDNGEVDILKKDVEDSILAIDAEIRYLQEKLESNTSSNEWLTTKMEYVVVTYNFVRNELESIGENFIPFIDLAKIIASEGGDNAYQRKKYLDLLSTIDQQKIFAIEWIYTCLKLVIKLFNDVPKLKSEYVLPHLNTTTLTHLKEIAKQVKNVREELSMLHEHINTEYIRAKVFDMDTLEEQKACVDELYAGKEKQNKVRESYFANYKIDSSKFHWNVSFLDGRKINNIDLFVGGSPCQSFSLVGKQRGLGDTRGTLFYEYARLVGEIRPKVFIYENVRAILSNDNGRTWETMTKIFEDLGYSWSYKILNAKDYGIPQNRERVFVVGFRNDLEVTDFKFPQPRELKTKMQDYLLDNVSGKYYLPKKGVEFVTSNKNLEKRYTQIDGEIQLCQKKNQQFNWHGDFVFEEERKDKEHLIEDLEKYFLSEKVKKYVLSSGTKGFYSKPEIDLEVARPLLTTMHKMHRAGIDNYVTTEGRLRKLTPRECLRLMGFCDSFKIVVSDTAMYQQSGNSIVVDVLIGILKQIFKCVPSIIN